eukprot:8010_1
MVLKNINKSCCAMKRSIIIIAAISLQFMLIASMQKPETLARFVGYVGRKKQTQNVSCRCLNDLQEIERINQMIQLNSMDVGCCMLHNTNISALNGANFSGITSHCPKLCIQDNKITEINDTRIKFPKGTFSIDLTNNFIHKCDLSNTPNLHWLSLAFNEITSLHSVKIKHCQTIYLNGNQIQSIQDYQFPLSRLICLENNNLKTLKNVTFNTRINKLNGNPITTMTIVQFNCYHETMDIELSNCNITSNILSGFIIRVNIKRHGQSIQRITLDLNNNKIESLRNFSIPQGITHLQLLGNPIIQLANSYPLSLQWILLNSNFELDDNDFVIMNTTFSAKVHVLDAYIAIQLLPKHVL